MKKLLSYLVACLFMAGIGQWTFGGTAMAIEGAGACNVLFKLKKMRQAD